MFGRCQAPEALAACVSLHHVQCVSSFFHTKSSICFYNIVVVVVFFAAFLISFYKGEFAFNFTYLYLLFLLSFCGLYSYRERVVAIVFSVQYKYAYICM